MKIIGITGGIGSGKSLVSEILMSKGFFVYNSDTRAKYLMNNNPDLISKIKNIFGDNIYDSKNILDRKSVSKIVFSDPEKLNELNKLVHPCVDEDFEFWKLHHRYENLLFKESAILYETGNYKKCDAILLVTADQSLRIERASQRDQISREEVLKRIQNQLPEDRKIELADFIIYNNGTIKELNIKVEETIQEITSRFF